MKILSILCLLGLLISTLTAQESFNPQYNLEQLGNLGSFNVGAVAFDNRYEGVKGSALLFDNWKIARIRFVGQDTLGIPVKMNVDVYAGNIAVLLPSGSIGQSALRNAQEFQLQEDGRPGNTYRVAPERDISGSGNAIMLYEVIYDGNVQLLKSIKKIFREADYKGAYAMGNPYDEIITETDYWLGRPGEPYEKIKLRRKDMQKAMPAAADRLSAIAKAQKLNWESEADIARLLATLEAEK